MARSDFRADFPADAFAGTADYYARFRPPYPRRLLTDLVERAGVSGDGRLLDLGCGPGRLALPLASWFSEVWAVDLEPEMIEVAKREAERTGIRNVRWIVGRAEDVVADAGPFELAVIGEAFHRFDQLRVAKLVLEGLVPGGGLAIVGCYGVLSGPEPWKGVLAEVVRRWRTERIPPSHLPSGVPAGSGPEHSRRVLERMGFEDIVSEEFNEPLEWDVESILGVLFSMSTTSRAVLGDTVDAFESAVRDALLRCEPSGRLREDLSCGYTLGRKQVS